jgi:hypothetical protein
MPNERERELQRRIEQQNATLREIEHNRIMREAHDRQALQEAAAVSRAREEREARDAEVEAQRKASWSLYLSDPQGPEFSKLIEERFNPILMQARIPPSSWPPGDGPEQHQYVNGPLPIIQDGATPGLVTRANALLARLNKA